MPSLWLQLLVEGEGRSHWLLLLVLAFLAGCAVGYLLGSRQ